MTIYSLDVHLFQSWTGPVVPCPVLTVASCPAYRFLRRQVRWSGIPISLRIFKTKTKTNKQTKKTKKKSFPVCFDPHKGFSIVNEAQVDVFLEFLCFFYESTRIGNLISGSSAFPKSSWYIWKFSVHVLLSLA